MTTPASDREERPGAGIAAGVGARLRAERRAQMRTLADVAELSGLTKGFLSKVERSQTAPSVAALIRICEALGLSIGELFGEHQNRDLVRTGEYPPISFGGRDMDESLLTPARERRIQVIHSVIRPGGGSGDEPYALPVEVEFVYVLKGSLRLVLGETTTDLRAGDALTFTPTTSHAFENPDEREDCEVLWVLSPALAAGRTSAGSRRRPNSRRD